MVTSSTLGRWRWRINSRGGMFWKRYRCFVTLSSPNKAVVPATVVTPAAASTFLLVIVAMIVSPFSVVLSAAWNGGWFKDSGCHLLRQAAPQTRASWRDLRARRYGSAWDSPRRNRGSGRTAGSSRLAGAGSHPSATPPHSALRGTGY